MIALDLFLFAVSGSLGAGLGILTSSVFGHRGAARRVHTDPAVLALFAVTLDGGYWMPEPVTPGGGTRTAVRA